MLAIEVENLVKIYDKKVLAVDHISFSVNEGELFAFLGENGAGKSTTINILCTLLRKTEGKVQIMGHLLDEDDDAIRNLIGIVFQNSVLDKKLTVKENLYTRASYYGLSKKETQARILPFLKIFELEEFLNQRYEKLSGGQKRRVDIVRALINNPKILFLDEPTTGLDPKSRKIVWEYIDKLRKETGLTIFLTTHYMEEISDADRVVILNKGQIIENDTPANLKSKYSCNKLLWYVEKNQSHEEILKDYRHEYDADHYKVFIEQTEIIDFLSQHSDIIKDFEILKGTMDEVFLTLTGKEIE